MKRMEIWGSDWHDELVSASCFNILTDTFSLQSPVCKSMP